jgi:hypothetical protein
VEGTFIGKAVPEINNVRLRPEARRIEATATLSGRETRSSQPSSNSIHFKSRAPRRPSSLFWERAKLSISVSGRTAPSGSP